VADLAAGGYSWKIDTLACDIRHHIPMRNIVQVNRDAKYLIVKLRVESKLSASFIGYLDSGMATDTRFPR
jgi:hypothetical protein